jgi:dUTP pyrophosphatase
MENKVNIKKLDQNATIPKYGTDYAAGADLYTCNMESVTLKPNETYFFHTGIALEIPNGYAGFIYARSGLGTKKGLAPANKVGVIDSDYRGDIIIALHNHSTKEQTIEPQERIAQLVIAPYYKAIFNEVDELNDTTRGETGFGSTGTK